MPARRNFQLLLSKRCYLLLLSSLILSILPSITYADVVWPGLFIHVKSYSLIPIVIGLFIEFLIFRKIFELTFLKCLWVVLVANAISAIVGYFLYVFYGIEATFVSHQIQHLFSPKAGTFTLFIWACDFFAFALFTTIIEYLAVRFLLKIKFNIRSKTFMWFFIANILSTGVAVLMAIVDPPRL